MQENVRGGGGWEGTIQGWKNRAEEWEDKVKKNEEVVKKLDPHEGES